MEEIGTFEVKGDQLRVSDPCYERDTWCAGVIKKVLPGKWNAMVEMWSNDKTHGWGERVAVLRVEHEDYTGRLLNKQMTYEDSGIDVGVDSGQCGIYDESRYQLDGKGEYGEDGTWYGEACKCTHGKEDEFGRPLKGEPYFTAGILNLYGGPLGVVSSSGYGDGSYSCEVERDPDGNAVAVTVTFLDDEEDEEYEDEE